MPYVAVFLAFALYPIAYGLWLGSDPRLYLELLDDPHYPAAALNTALFAGFGTNVMMFAALLLSGFFMRRRWWIKVLLGVCLLPSQPGDAYQPDLALALVGRFIANDLVDQYNRDWERTGNPNLVKGDRKMQAEPWKTHSARLAQALTDLKNATKGAKAKQVADIAGKAQDILKVMEVRKKVDDELPKRLSKALADLKPAEEVYKGNTDYVIKLASEE